LVVFRETYPRFCLTHLCTLFLAFSFSFLNLISTRLLMHLVSFLRRLPTFSSFLPASTASLRASTYFWHFHAINCDRVHPVRLWKRFFRVEWQ